MHVYVRIRMHVRARAHRNHTRAHTCAHQLALTVSGALRVQVEGNTIVPCGIVAPARYGSIVDRVPSIVCLDGVSSVLALFGFDDTPGAGGALVRVDVCDRCARMKCFAANKQTNKQTHARTNLGDRKQKSKHAMRAQLNRTAARTSARTRVHTARTPRPPPFESRARIRTPPRFMPPPPARIASPCPARAPRRTRSPIGPSNTLL